MNKDKLRQRANQIFDDLRTWNELVSDLNYSEKLFVNRIVNNMIRQEYY